MTDEHLCPRREEGVPAFARETKDHWYDRDGYPCCSYCGSLNPDRFMECAEAGVEIGPTDKSYKVYIDLPDPKAGELKITGTANGDTPPGTGWTAATTADFAEYYEGRTPPADNNLRWVLRTPRQSVHGKFYFQHLSDAQQTRFIELINARTLVIGFPGRFYVLPFFVKMVR